MERADQKSVRIFARELFGAEAFLADGARAYDSLESPFFKCEKGCA